MYPLCKADWTYLDNIEADKKVDGEDLAEEHCQKEHVVQKHKSFENKLGFRTIQHESNSVIRGRILFNLFSIWKKGKKTFFVEHRL